MRPRRIADRRPLHRRRAAARPERQRRLPPLSGSGRPMIDWVREIAARARYVVAIGSCTAYGGITASRRKPHRRLRAAIRRRERRRPARSDFRAGLGPAGDQRRRLSDASRLDRRYAGCPGGWQVAAPSTSTTWQRPRFYCRATGPPRLPAQRVLRIQGQRREASDLGCLMENLGCKGTQAHADCNLRPWNGVGSCLRGGFACIALYRTRFRGTRPPFMETPKVAGIPIGLPPTCPRPGSSRWPPCPSRRRRSGCARTLRDHQLRAPAVKKGRPK
jgi:hypothetical protein